MRRQELDVLEWEQCYYYNAYYDLQKKMDVVAFQKKLNELIKVLECLTQGPYF